MTDSSHCMQYCTISGFLIILQCDEDVNQHKTALDGHLKVSTSICAECLLSFTII